MGRGYLDGVSRQSDVQRDIADPDIQTIKKGEKGKFDMVLSTELLLLDWGSAPSISTAHEERTTKPGG